MGTQIRISKYDPTYRINGIYTRDEWTSFFDIGHEFLAEGLLSEKQYLEVEDRYVGCILEIATHCGVRKLKIKYLENRWDLVNWQDKQVLDFNQADQFIRDGLREQCYGELGGKGFLLYFGYEYYVTVRSRLDLAELTAISNRYGLFIDRVKTIDKVYRVNKR